MWVPISHNHLQAIHATFPMHNAPMFPPKAAKWQFIIVDKTTITHREVSVATCNPESKFTNHIFDIFSMLKQVESDHNYDIIVEFLAGFAHDIPTAADMKDSFFRLSMQVHIIWYLVDTYASVLILTNDHDQFFPGCLGLVQRALSVEPLQKPQASRGLPT